MDEAAEPEFERLVKGRELFLDKAHLGERFGAGMDEEQRDRAERLIGNYERVRDGEMVVG